jgi:hypothetical protein
MGDEEDIKVEPPNAEEKAMEDLARLPSTLPDLKIELRSFPTESLADSVRGAVYFWLHLFGKVLNLKRLLRVIVAYDYHETLAGLDRGAITTRPLTATNDEVAIGIPMAPAVLHEGEPRSVLVLNALYMLALTQTDSPEYAELREEMTYTLAHECGHVHDLEMQASCLPGMILTTQLSFRDEILFGIASGCWDEYIACRLSAFMGKEFTLRGYEDTFCAALERAKGCADAAIRQYRMHHDVERVTQEVSGVYKKVFVYASYLIGHIDGLDSAVDECAPKAMDAIVDNDYFKPFFGELQDELRAMHGTYGDWKTLDVYEPLKQLSCRLLKVGGIDIQTRPDGAAYVDVPRRPETMPTQEDMAAFWSGRKDRE